ncbi:MAG TPA: aromatic-ring-hydroxylating dioxygenase subunit beta [Caldimonas sp.]|jgi:p-cumate 2,3-dioxygenase beta subunit|nr:aromatic-ring-hydroxylating dioxygenase subunit beta [Caldimonas sp.]HEX2540360.1 aromatic-ring-hydroxylating dioxygenase subunit beta [Caldimonas sp.]
MSAVMPERAEKVDASAAAAGAAEARPIRAEIEEFLFHEAALLDDWKVADWAKLFTDDGEYMVPPTDDPHADPKTTLFLIYDDRHRLEERGKRLMSKQAHAEFPHSRTVHLYGNVRILESDPAGETTVRCSFLVSRNRGAISETYPGHMLFRLVRIDGRWRIRLKRAELALEVLRPHGKVSIIL